MALPDRYGEYTNNEAYSETNTNNISREEAINQAISALAAGDSELGRMLDAQSERLRYVFKTLPGLSGQEPEIDQALETNESVRRTLQTLTNMQMISNQKLSELLGN